MSAPSSGQTEYDVIIIGSGFGGSMVALQLVNAGKRALMLERGDWVGRGDHNWALDGSVDLTPHYSKEIPYHVLAGGASPVMGAYTCVGGPSVFYGAVSLRLREKDFAASTEIVNGSGAAWPVKYPEFEPYYSQAERLLNIAGEANADPCEPARSADYPQKSSPLSDTSKMIKIAAESFGLQPFRLPLAINYSDYKNQRRCLSCTTCDTFACAIQAKNDLATRVIPDLLEKGMDLRSNTIVTSLHHSNKRITKVGFFDKTTNEFRKARAKTVILSAGAIASAHLLLAAKLDQLNPGGKTIGRYLTRHCNAIAFGFFPKKPNPKNQFHKQLGFHDFYFGHASIAQPEGKLGSIQQLQTPPIGLVKGMVPKPLGHLLAQAVPHLTGLLVMAEDQPQFKNGVSVDFGRMDKFGLPQLEITHHYSKRDYAARDALLSKSGMILKKAGAKIVYNHKIKTFSHAVGTIRMGNDATTSALDENCQFRGLDNLFVVDGSFMPTSGGVNPSLTIGANALRVGKYIARMD